MNDQATRLRELIKQSRLMRQADNAPHNAAEPTTKPVKKDARVISISSGKGGVGKTNIAVNLALALQTMGKRVAVIDADLGLANIDVVLGMVPRFNLIHLINEDKTLDEITVIGPLGIKVISGGSGVMDLVNLTDDAIKKLIKTLEVLNETSDYIIIDTGAGLNKSVMSFIEATDEVIVVVTPDPTSITDAYAVIKNIKNKQKQIKIIINQADSSKESVEVFNKLRTVADKFLGIELIELGFILNDNNVKKSIRMQQPYYIAYPNTTASKGISLIAHHLESSAVVTSESRSFGSFIKRLFTGQN